MIFLKRKFEFVVIENLKNQDLVSEKMEMFELFLQVVSPDRANRSCSRMTLRRGINRRAFSSKIPQARSARGLGGLQLPHHVTKLAWL